MVQQKSKGYIQQGCSIPLIHERVKMGESGGVSKLGRRVWQEQDNTHKKKVGQWYKKNKMMINNIKGESTTRRWSGWGGND